MSGQADWYLHEGARGDSPISPVGGSLGAIEFYQCGDPVMLDASSVWPALEVGDYILAMVMWENTGSNGDPTVLPAGWDYIFHRYNDEATDLGGGINGYRHAGPQLHWTGHFVTAEDISSSFTFDHVTSGKQVCVKAYALRNVDKRAPVDYLYLSGTGFNTQSLGATGVTRCTPWMATRLNSYGGLQVSCHGTKETADNSGTWRFSVVAGPEPDYATNWTMPNSVLSLTQNYCHALVYFDFVTPNNFSEVTSTPPCTSASGGARVWGALKTDQVWISASRGSSYVAALNVSATPVSSMAVLYKSASLGPGQYLFWSGVGNIHSIGDFVYMAAVNDTDGITLGTYFKPNGAPAWTVYESPAIGGARFDEDVCLYPDMDGLPNYSVAVCGGLFSLSFTASVTFKIGVLGGADDILAARNTSAWRFTQLGCNPTNKSVLTPGFTNLVDFPGISRAHLGSPAYGWSTDFYSSIYGLTFQLNKRGSLMRKPGLIGVFNPWIGGTSENWRGARQRHSNPDYNTSGVSQLDRWVFPRIYLSNDDASATYGHYYAELTIQNFDSFGALNDPQFIGIMGPCNVHDGHHLRTGVFIFGEGGVAEESLYFENQTGTWTGLGTTNGIEIDYVNAVLKFYKDGVNTLSWDMTARGRTVPYTLVLKSNGYIGNWSCTWIANTQGPFSAKPAGAIAYDFVNEVS